MRVGVSFISIEQARRNLDQEIPDGQNVEETATKTHTAWKDKLDLIKIEGNAVTRENLTTFYTAFYHTLQVVFIIMAFIPKLIKRLKYPYEQDEDGRYYSGYDDTVHEGASYTGYSIWVNYFPIHLLTSNPSPCC